MMQDTINSIRVTLNERIGNPFISASAIACLILNWKLTLLLFSDVSYDNKIEKIAFLYPDFSARLDNLFLIPLYFGVFWTFVWPVISLGINAYWYWMKSNISNVKLKVERKKILSEAEAAELYSMIDAQESKYLEFLKDRQSKIERLSNEISDLIKERNDLQNKVEKCQSEYTDLESKLSGSQRELGTTQEALTKTNREIDDQKRALDNILGLSIEFAGYLPGLRAITDAINKTTNYQANEAWIWEELNRQETSFPNENHHRQKILNLFLSIGLLKRMSNGNITFGEQYQSAKDRVLDMNDNPPGITVLS